MIINLRKSTLFTVDPDLRFSQEYKVPLGTWQLLYQRHKLLEYSIYEMLELYQIKTGKVLTPKSIHRWLWRTEVYSRAKSAIDKGAESVVSHYFGKHELEVVKELMKNIRSSVKGKTSTIV